MNHNIRGNSQQRPRHRTAEKQIAQKTPKDRIKVRKCLFSEEGPNLPLIPPSVWSKEKTGKRGRRRAGAPASPVLQRDTPSDLSSSRLSPSSRPARTRILRSDDQRIPAHLHSALRTLCGATFSSTQQAEMSASGRCA